MHIFLSGIPGVGKSTIITSITEKLPIEINGFCTLAEKFEKCSSSYVYMYNIIKGNKDSRVAVAYRYGDGRFKGYKEAFDDFGSKTLSNLEGSDLIIMDELGFMENEAKIFQEKVISVLNGNIPVLGVIKPMNTEFLNRIRNHKKVKVFDVNVENRNNLKEEVSKYLYESLNGKNIL
ncbi:nucleoside-triphosphatase [Anaerovorax odorimutans]|uniref:nucleoside-triphosphatase n=1 Tax=Anaerovorax odorimutans TaxID=109327 RepID=UPI000409FF8B|nr:nucleoside-triphosphatase [Anaerovorax odorimutans]